MKHAAWITLTYALLALLSPLLGYLDAQLYAPDVALLTALFAGSRCALGPALATGFAAGVVKDGFSLSSPVGTYTEICALVALVGQFLQHRVDLVSPMPVMATAAATSLVSSAAFLGLVAVFGRTFEAYGAVLTAALPLALTTMLWAPLQFALLDRIGRKLDLRGRGAVLLRR